MNFLLKFLEQPRVTARTYRAAAIFSTLPCLLFAHPALASTQSRPPLGGYSYSIYLYPDAEVLAKLLCGTGVVDHMEYGNDANEGNNFHPSFRGMCKYGGPNGWVEDSRPWNYWAFACPGTAFATSRVAQACLPVDKPSQSCPSPEHGNPIDLIKREKVQRETDYASAAFQFTRFYTNAIHAPNMESATQNVWRHSFLKKLTSSKSGSYSAPVRYAFVPPRGWPNDATFSPTLNTALVSRPDSSSLYFASQDQGSTWSADSDVNYRLSSEKDASSLSDLSP